MPKINVNDLAKLSASLATACSNIKSFDFNASSNPNLADIQQFGKDANSPADALKDIFNDFESGNNKPVSKYFNDLADAADDVGSAGNLASAQTKVAKLLTMVDVSETSDQRPSDLQRLFRNISTSLISAQKELNQSSLEYAASLDPRLPQTLYGIPSVKAEMRVGFNKLEEKGVNLFFLTSQKQKQEFAESVVSFEVIGTPPPPGPTSFGDYVVPIPRLIVVDGTREAILNEILARKILTGTTYTSTRDRAVVLRYQPSDDGRTNKYLVIWYAQKGSQADWFGLSLIYVIGRVTSNGENEIFEFPTIRANSIFEYQPNVLESGTLKPIPVLTIPPGQPTKPEKIDPFANGDTDIIKLGKLSIDLGDVLMNVNQIVNDWLDSVKVKPPQ